MFNLVTITASNHDKIPSELKSLRQWVVWRFETRNEKQTKIPYNAKRPKQCASTTDATTWATYDEAVHACDQQQFSGIGFVFTKDDPYFGVDLDKCRNLKTGELIPEAQLIVEQLNSYCEVSPSGTGVHVIGKAKLPEGGKRKGQVEMYDHARFFLYDRTACEQHSSRSI